MVQTWAAEGRHILIHVFGVGAVGESWAQNVCSKYIKLVVNGVPVAPHGPTFGQNESYRLQEVFEHLGGAFSVQKHNKQHNNPKHVTYPPP